MTDYDSDYFERLKSPTTWAELRDARCMALGSRDTTRAQMYAELARLDGLAAEWRERDEREAVARVVEAVRSGACRTRGGWA